MARLRRFLVVFGLLLIPGGAFVLWPGRHPPAGAQTAQPLQSSISPSQSPAIQEGQLLFQEHCATCHGEQAQGSSLAPAIVGRGPAVWDFMLSTGRMPIDRIVTQATRKEPAFNRAQIDSIIAFLSSLSAPGTGTPIPNVRPNEGSLSGGAEVFQANCAPCHGATGNGGAVGMATAPNLHKATATQIGEAVRIGPGFMPLFGPNTISDQQLNSLARYVLTLRNPDDPGGGGLGHTGPIIEGFVALLAGLGVMVIVTRFIGTRR